MRQVEEVFLGETKAVSTGFNVYILAALHILGWPLVWALGILPLIMLARSVAFWDQSLGMQ